MVEGSTLEVAITWLPDPAMLSLRGDAVDAAFARAVGGALGALLPRANRFVESAGWTILWLGPDEWMLVGDQPDAAPMVAALESALKGQHATVTDVSGNRVVVRIEGPGARDLLAGGCSLDLDPRAFATGQAASTLFARAGVLLVCRAEHIIDVLPRRSFAPYLAAWLDGAAVAA